MVSAIILSYNRCEDVLFTINILKTYRKTVPFEVEIVVVDNASIDDTSAQIRQLHPDVTLVTKKVNNGIAGWNEGFKIAKHKYFLVLDDDSHIHAGLAEGIVFMEANTQIGILAFETVDINLKMDVFLKDDDAWKDGDSITGFIGCGAVIRKQLYDQIGGYADWIYLYTHEFEYGIRCLAAGYLIQFFSKGIVVHRVSKVNRLSKNMRVYATRNELEIINKYFTKHKTMYLFRTFFNNLKFVKREGFKSGFYILKGAYQFLILRNKIPLSPVSIEVQEFYARNFWSTKPFFQFLKTRFNKFSKKLKA
ncbi:glycosyltransferase family 2 protein [Mucilaginibacter sp.]|uniref:glycosyltransferase family 2 protein n=1 Tax=Mucilaginibacter sp. TaxID=1882438 RepID=UPI003D0C7F6E